MSIGTFVANYKHITFADKLKKRGQKYEKKFPDVDWYCDRCNAYLNIQPGFDDHHYVWKCTECGFKNSISSDSIIGTDEDDIHFNR